MGNEQSNPAYFINKTELGKEILVHLKKTNPDAGLNEVQITLLAATSPSYKYRLPDQVKRWVQDNHEEIVDDLEGIIDIIYAGNVDKASDRVLNIIKEKVH